jgi:D-sedoheptulose 7-phosphate isomerase
MRARVQKEIDDSVTTKKLLKSETESIVRLIETVVESLKGGGKLILFGNGGSAADAQHIAAEFAGRYLIERKALPAIALSANTSSLTAIGNDYGYEHVFERQVQALCTNKDVVIGISTSGKSKNVILGLKAAGMMGARTIGLTGRSGGDLSAVADFTVKVPSDSTPRIQECHILIGHILSALVESRFV